MVRPLRDDSLPESDSRCETNLYGDSKQPSFGKHSLNLQQGWEKGVEDETLPDKDSTGHRWF